MKCTQAKLFISWAMDEPLPEYERARLEIHLQGCGPCVSYRTQLLAGRELFARAMAAPSDNFEWKVQLKIQQALREAAARGIPSRERPRFWLPVGLTAATTALAVLVVGGLVLLEPDAGLQPSTVAPLAENVQPSPLASVESQPADSEATPDAEDAGGTSTPVGAPGRRVGYGATRNHWPSDQAGWTSGAPDLRTTAGAAVQQVGGGGEILTGSPLTPLDYLLSPGRWPSSPELAVREQLEHDLLLAQQRADRIRRQLEDLEVAGVIVLPESTVADSAMSGATPRR